MTIKILLLAFIIPFNFISWSSNKALTPEQIAKIAAIEQATGLLPDLAKIVEEYARITPEIVAQDIQTSAMRYLAQNPNINVVWQQAISRLTTDQIESLINQILSLSSNDKILVLGHLYYVTLWDILYELKEKIRKQYDPSSTESELIEHDDNYKLITERIKKLNAIRNEQPFKMDSGDVYLVFNAIKDKFGIPAPGLLQIVYPQIYSYIYSLINSADAQEAGLKSPQELEDEIASLTSIGSDIG